MVPESNSRAGLPEMSIDTIAANSGWPALFRNAFTRSKNAMVLLDEERRTVDINGAFVQLLGYPRRALLGRPAREVVTDGPLMSSREWRAALHKKQFTGIAPLIRADGGRVAVEFAGHPEVVTGKQLVLVVVLRAARGNRRLRDPDARSKPAKLTPREREVVSLLALGNSGPEIAEELHVSHNTVRSHVNHAMSKLGARSRAQLVAKSMGEGHLWSETS